MDCHISFTTISPYRLQKITTLFRPPAFTFPPQMMSSLLSPVLVVFSHVSCPITAVGRRFNLYLAIKRSHVDPNDQSIRNWSRKMMAGVNI
jgi:hypothetical protein